MLRGKNFVHAFKPRVDAGLNAKCKHPAREGHARGLTSLLFLTHAYRRRLNTDCGEAFACAKTVLADCARIWLRVRFAVSAAKSVSRIALSAALAFSYATPSELIVLPR